MNGPSRPSKKQVRRPILSPGVINPRTAQNMYDEYVSRHVAEEPHHFLIS